MSRETKLSYNTPKNIAGIFVLKLFGYNYSKNLNMVYSNTFTRFEMEWKILIMYIAIRWVHLTVYQLT